MDRADSETFDEFKDSFAYGERTDLTFKFLKRLTPDAAAEALRQMLSEIGTSLDTGDLTRLHDLIVEWQITAYAGAERSYRYEQAPFTPLRRPLADCRVGMVTSSGHFVAGDDPAPFGVADMTQVEAVERIFDFLREAPVLSTIPRDTSADELRVRHGGYDIRSAVKDHNVVFPRDALLELAAQGRIGEVAENLYSFPGAAAQGRLLQVLPEWVEALAGDRLDALLLVPV